MLKDLVEILLATHNGEKYLEEQLDSIINQSYKNILITIRDDSSTDGTREILEKYSKKFSTKIQVFCNTFAPDGPITNFSKLISISKANYIMFADQDDFWYSDKVSKLLEKIKLMETEYGQQSPLLVHSDLKVANNNLEVIHSSFWKYAGLKYENNAFGRLLVQNVITGSASIFNRALANAATNIPNEAIMHDWWLALIASAIGQIGAINESTSLYRQHDDNTLGAKEYSLKIENIFIETKRIFNPKYTSKLLAKNILQAQFFKQMMFTKLPVNIQIQLDAFLELKKKNKLIRMYLILRYKFLPGNLVQRIGFLIAV